MVHSKDIRHVSIVHCLTDLFFSNLTFLICFSHFFSLIVHFSDSDIFSLDPPRNSETRIDMRNGPDGNRTRISSVQVRYPTIELQAPANLGVMSEPRIYGLKMLMWYAKSECKS